MVKTWFSKKYEEWQEMQPIFRYLMIGIVAVFVPLMIYNAFFKAPPKHAPQAAAASPSGGGVLPSAAAAEPGAPAAGAAPQPGGFQQRILPDSLRNQGLEVVMARLDSIEASQHRQESVIDTLQSQNTRTLRGGALGAPAAATDAPVAASSTAGAAAQRPDPLGKDLPAAVSWDQPGASGGKVKSSLAADAATQASDATMAAPAAPLAPPRPTMVSDKIDTSAQANGGGSRPPLVLPMYTGIEAVMLSGVNARPSGSNEGSAGGAAGRVTSALDVGAPFVTRIKGVAIMPNSWKASDLENCFVGGSATAVLSAERAYAIADHISCIFKNGEVYEGAIKAYALDVDGTLGLAGKVVNKQGAMLMQAALTGMAAGLGSALSPTAVSSYNTNAGQGTAQSYTVPSPAYLAGTAVGQGVNHAATELSQFYLNFAKETFPVVEVTAGTRVTWILEQDIELKKHTNTKEAG